MSGPRRVGGRFVTTDEHTTYTRALVAPAAVWKKQWVVPSGLTQESKYKVLKWVKVDSQQDFSEESDSSLENGLSNIENDKPTLELPPAPTLRSHVSFALDSKPEVGAEAEDVEMSGAEPATISATALNSAVVSAPAEVISSADPSVITPTSIPTEAPIALLSELEDITKPSVSSGSDDKGSDVAQIVESEMSGMAVDGVEEGGDGKGEGAHAIAQDERLKESALDSASTADEKATADMMVTMTAAYALGSEPLLPTATADVPLTSVESAIDHTAAASDQSGLSTNAALPPALPLSLPIASGSSSALPSSLQTEQVSSSALSSSPPLSTPALAPTDISTSLQPTVASSSSNMPIFRTSSVESLNPVPKPDTATVLPSTGAMDITAAGTGEDPVGEGARIGGGVNILSDQPDTN